MKCAQCRKTIEPWDPVVVSDQESIVLHKVACADQYKPRQPWSVYAHLSDYERALEGAD